MRRVRALCLIPCFAAGVRSAGIYIRAVPSAISYSSSYSLSASPTTKPSSTSASARPTALLYFDGIPQLTTCEQATFTWKYTGPISEQLLLYITDDDQAQQSATANSSGVPNSNPRNVTIADNIDPSLGTYTWQSVNVPSSWYKLNANISSQSFSVSSTAFYVHAGTNTACLTSTSPFQSHTPGSHTNMGAIVGGVLGGVVLVLAAALAYLLYTRRLNKSGAASPSTPYTEDRKHGRKPFLFPTRSWDQLRSIDSHMLVSAATTSGTGDTRASDQRQRSIHSARHKSFSDSVNLPVLDYSRDVSRASLNGDEEKGSPTSMYSYKSPIDSGPSPPIDSTGLPQAPISRLQQPRPDPHAAPEQAHIQDSRRPDKTYAAHLDRANSARRKPSDSSLAASTIMSLVSAAEQGSGRSSLAPSPTPQSRSQLDLTRNPISSSTEFTSPDLNSPATPGSAPKSSKPRKAVRKPVPLYDPSVDPDYISTSVSSSFAHGSSSPEMITPSSPTNVNHPLYTEDPFARPEPLLSSKSSTGTLNGSPTSASGGHYVARLQAQTGAQRELAHKSSLGFEGRQMHYLIPDMPLPQKK
ncbi:hypothetical protein AX15_007944 [Amanita polypyramis BW_CC]|nr:hypothetical protein AX15_007944 [Amanita polypyramis BW_CC]